MNEKTCPVCGQEIATVELETWESVTLVLQSHGDDRDPNNPVPRCTGSLQPVEED